MTTPSQPPFSPHHFHRITNTSNSSNPTLDVINDVGRQNSTGLLKLTREGYYSGQYWSFTPSGTHHCPPQASEPSKDTTSTSNTTYRIQTWWLGPNRQLDVYADDMSKAVLRRADATDTANALDWSVGQWDDGTWWIGNEASGVLKVLDVGEREDRREVVLSEKDEGRKTQRWRVEVTREILELEYHERPITPTPE
ncbi:hypothetical protein AA0113_g11020 [Alternaria arborescens]|uniref:Ricin B lectin domain-containing protein n=1 Tax=Alternaria arborescens TaxID=156630 RepID=A0A4V1WZK3_9PLEO|nr:hypothetical protein AA0112_g4098 [Alternaria arborescens]RYO41483.1 hypothetical protein AA0113_g11020 [Alternaria arborescens]